MIPSVLADQQPEPTALLRAAQDAARIDSLAHCRTAIEAALAGDVPDHGRELSALEEAQCAFAEQLAFSVASVTDHQVATLLGFLSEAEVWAFVVAVYEIDMDVRLGLVAGEVL